ncbi:ABC transporter ATP-binding protein [Halorientalis sp.]|uniref:ABC transporter ATP-binding protein n=1 Tax=Halorientalis sp. TaxID=1931229 RepID=UPI0026255A3E|nr:ABC transporter ATP-binding protein [Halorientalis sp.]
MTSADTPLEVENLRKEFGGLVAVDDLSFEVNSNEILGFIGPNGAGKSTVFNCIMGVLSPTDGSVYLHSDEITGQDTHETVNQGLARVSQESNPFEEMTVEDNIRIFAVSNSPFAFSSNDDEEVIRSLARRMGLEDELGTLPDSLPHAGRRRLEIAKALATEPDILLLDEPFAGMNQAEIRDLSEEIRGFRDEGITLVVVDHNMRGLMQLVDRVIVLNEGRKLADGTPEEVADDERVQSAYLAGEV